MKSYGATLTVLVISLLLASDTLAGLNLCNDNECPCSIGPLPACGTPPNHITEGPSTATITTALPHNLNSTVTRPVVGYSEDRFSVIVQNLADPCGNPLFNWRLCFYAVQNNKDFTALPLPPVVQAPLTASSPGPANTTATIQVNTFDQVVVWVKGGGFAIADGILAQSFKQEATGVIQPIVGDLKNSTVSCLSQNGKTTITVAARDSGNVPDVLGNLMFEVPVTMNITAQIGKTSHTYTTSSGTAGNLGGTGPGTKSYTVNTVSNPLTVKITVGGPITDPRLGNNPPSTPIMTCNPIFNLPCVASVTLPCNASSQ